MSDDVNTDDAIAKSAEVVAGFNAEMDRFQNSVGKTKEAVVILEKGLNNGLRQALDGVILDGKTLSESLKSVGQSMMMAAYNAAMKPITSGISNAVGGLVGSMLPFADGGVISQGRVVPFAKGGVLSGPTTFPMAGATGLMGEAGPEAIMPLTRGADGRLGVAAQGGGGGTHITMNIQTPDAASFQRSQSQIAASMQRAMSRGQRNT